MNASNRSVTIPWSVGETHSWLKRLNVAFLPEPSSRLQAELAEGMRAAFADQGHVVQSAPDDTTDLLFAFARFGEPLSWREAPFLQARRMYRLQRQPTVVMILNVGRDEWERLLHHLDAAIRVEPPDPADFDYPGLAPSAYRTLVEQGRRGGPVLAAQRLLQAQVICLRILLVVGDTRPERVYHFDLVGSLAHSEGSDAELYHDIIMRVATAASAEEIGAYTVTGEPISAETWSRLSAPPAMRRASLELDRRNFFTETVRVHDLVHVPALSGAIANQYSEGCFATWEPEIDALDLDDHGQRAPREQRQHHR